jgi:Zn-dependent peptidase ImmA (M78 family)
VKRNPIPERLRHEALSHPDLPPVDREVVERWLQHAVEYGVLEQIVLDDVRYDVPIHQISVNPDGATVEEEARELADTARESLDMQDFSEDLVRTLEEKGARVYEMTLSPAVFGLFAFDGETGPAFLLNSCLRPAAARVVLAELYAHFFAHTDPYRVEVVLADPATPARDDEAEIRRARARAFALEFTMPYGLTRSTVESAAGAPVGALMAEMFDVPVSVACARLREFDAEEPTVATDEYLGPDRGDRVPERFIRLALEGMHTDRMSVEELAMQLDVTREEAIDLLRLSSSDDDGNGGEPTETPPPPEP